MKKPTSLTGALARKAPLAVQQPAAPTGSSEGIKTLTLRLPAAVHDQLREMAYHSRRSQHALLLDGLNLLFEAHGKPPIAS